MAQGRRAVQTGRAAMAPQTGSSLHGMGWRGLSLTTLTVIALAVAGQQAWQRGWLGPFWVPLRERLVGERSVAEVMGRYGEAALARLAPALDAAGFGSALPERLRFVAMKEERQLEMWGNDGTAWRRIATYPIRAASGGPGPKLMEGDRQVPEGLYSITHLNPNSAYHLSLGIAYPNAEDLAQAEIDGRTDPGGDIMIHGKAVSVGCLAMGDTAIEEIFALVARVGTARSDILIVPHDLRVRPARDDRDWVAARYAELAELLTALPAPADEGLASD